MWLVTVYFFFINIVGLAVLFGARSIDSSARANAWVAWAWWQTCRAAQAMYSISTAFALTIFILYWVLIFNGESDQFELYRDYSQHGFYAALFST